MPLITHKIPRIAPSKYIYYSRGGEGLKVTEEATTDAWRMEHDIPGTEVCWK